MYIFYQLYIYMHIKETNRKGHLDLFNTQNCFKLLLYNIKLVQIKIEASNRMANKTLL